MARVWVLTSGKMGDDKQSLRLAAALGAPFEEKKIVFNDSARAWRVMLGPSLASIDETQSSPLESPWPDIVISSGWRQVPVVRWIKRQSGESTRLVQMNRPPGPKHFDLVLSPPQFSVPLRDNVVRLDWPLQLPPSVEALEQSRSEWMERLDAFPHPWTVVLLGGESYPFAFGRDEAKFLFDEASARVRAAGGSLLISTSRRTPESVLEASREAARCAPERTYLYEWQVDAPDNPYVALLEGGDEFIVTPDSVSMLVEVARLGRPIAIAPHKRTSPFAKWLRNVLKGLLHGQLKSPHSAFAEWVSDASSFLGLKYVRTLDSVSNQMVASGWAASFPEFAGGRDRPLPDDDFERVTERVRAMLEKSGGAPRR
jgi:mitochondrial fission protein ELM1